MNFKLVEIPFNSDRRLELNKIYRVEYIDINIYTNPYFREHAHELYEVFISDDISIGMYERCYFESIEDKRERIINKII